MRIRFFKFLFFTLPLFSLQAAAQSDAPPKARPTLAEVLKASTPAEWRSLDPNNTLYLELPSGRVVIELAPGFAPRAVANIKLLVKEKYFDGLKILRSQDNYVVQWGDPDEDEKSQRPPRSLGTAQRRLADEFSVPIPTVFPFTALKDGDVYAAEVGHAWNFPAARDKKQNRTWMTHCYAMVGVARDNASDSGNGSSLYVVNGHAPRQLDRNVTLVGRVMLGMERLSTLPRGTAALGFYAEPEQQTTINALRLAADVPFAERSHLEVLRSDSTAFAAAVNAVRYRGGDWFKHSPDRVELCNVPIPVRVIAQPVER